MSLLYHLTNSSLLLKLKMMVYAVDIKDFFGPAKTFPTLASIINVIIPNIFLLAGIILFVLLIAGGLMVIVGAGSSNPEQTGKGAKAITYAIAGFAIIFVSYWIIKIVEKVTGVPIFKPGF